MPLYVFFPGTMPGTKSLTAAKKAVGDNGATVVRTAAGSMLVEATPARAKRIVQALLGWQYTPERKTTRVPERRPPERAKALTAKTN